MVSKFINFSLKKVPLVRFRHYGNFQERILVNRVALDIFSQHNRPFSTTIQNNYKNRYNHYETADRSEKYPRFYKIYVGFISFLFILALFNIPNNCIFSIYDYLEEESEKRKKNETPLRVKCEARIENLEEDLKMEGESNEMVKRKKTGFRDRKFIAYEDRIRAYSTPDKIFRYFATLRVFDEDGPGEILMTPDDFVRAITPGLKQPDGLDLDSFLRYDPRSGAIWKKSQLSLKNGHRKNEHIDLKISEDSVFYTLGNKALISFSDFVFLLTVLSTPQRQFEIAFRMFDLNGDGELDSEEFETVRSVIMDTTPMGKRHRDHGTTGSKLKPNVNSALRQYFFGPNGDEKLTISRFLEFQRKLQMEIMRIEFNRFEPEDDRITEVAFAKSIITYGGFSENKRRKMLKRIKSEYSDPENQQGITFKEFVDFSKFLRNIADVDTALTFYNIAGAAIDQSTLLHVARAVASVELSPHLVNVVFRLFDENDQSDDDGQLSNKEFVSVMKNRLLRGLDRPMDTGFIRFVNSMIKCGKEQLNYRSV